MRILHKGYFIECSDAKYSIYLEKENYTKRIHSAAGHMVQPTSANYNYSVYRKFQSDEEAMQNAKWRIDYAMNSILN